MDHREIEERDIAVQYLTAKLPAEERHQFEEHFVDCPECLERIELLQGLRSGLRKVMAEDASQSLASSVPRWLSRLAMLSRGRQIVLAGGLAAVLALVLLVPLLQMIRLRRDLAQENQIAGDWKEKYASEQAANLKLQAELEANKQLAGATIFSLVSSRSADFPANRPVNSITVAPSVPWIVFSLEGAGQPGFQTYRAILKDNAGATIWQADGLSPGRDPFAIVVPSRLFKDGVYVLTLEGLSSGSPAVPLSHYSFLARVKQ